MGCSSAAMQGVASHYHVRNVFLRLVGLCFFVAFTSYYVQVSRRLPRCRECCARTRVCVCVRVHARCYVRL